MLIVDTQVETRNKTVKTKYKITVLGKYNEKYQVSTYTIGSFCEKTSDRRLNEKPNGRTPTDNSMQKINKPIKKTWPMAQSSALPYSC